ALVEAMHRAIRIVDRDAGLGKEPRRRRFAHPDRAGETEHEHHAPVFAAFWPPMSASSRARNSGVICGVAPNQRAKPGTAGIEIGRHTSELQSRVDLVCRRL